MSFLRGAFYLTLFLLFSLSYAQPESSDTLKNIYGGSAPYEQRAKTAQNLFTAGSIMAITGLIAISVSGNTEQAQSLGTALLVAGHSGMILTGISVGMMKKSVLEKYPKLDFDFEPTSGWKVYGAGLGIEAVGLTCIILAAKNTNDILGWGGVIGILAGELVTKLSWFSFHGQMKYWKNMFENVSVSPQVHMEKNGSNLFGSVLSVNF